MKNRTFGVVGLGNFGGTVAADLQRYGNHVIGIDSDEKTVSRFAETLSIAMIADGRDEEALKDTGLGDCSVVVVGIADDLEASVLTALNLKLLGVETIWAKAASKRHHRILSKLGVQRIVHPEVEIGQRTAQVLQNPQIRDYLSLGNGYHVVHFKVGDLLAGKTINELNLQDSHDLKSLGVMRGSKTACEAGESITLEEEDILLLIGKRNALRDFAMTLAP